MRSFLSIFFLSMCLPVFALNNPAGHKMVSYKLWKTVTKEELSEKMRKNHVPKSLLKPKYDVDIYDVQYVSHWHDGSEILASGLYFVPHGVGAAMPQVVSI